MKEFIIKVKEKEFTHLQYRFPALLIRSKVEDAFSSTKKIIIDFEGIHTISESYADEVYAKLLLKFEMEKIFEKIKFQNTNHFIKSVIRSALLKRIQEKS